MIRRWGEPTLAITWLFAAPLGRHYKTAPTDLNTLLNHHLAWIIRNQIRSER